MTHFLDLAVALYAEAHQIAMSVTYDDAPDLDDNARAVRGFARNPMPELGHLAIALEEAFWASLLSEELRPVRPRLMYLPEGADVGPMHPLVEGVPLERGKLRKLAPAHGTEGFWAWHVVAGKPVLRGVVPRLAGSSGFLTVTVSGSGALDIDWGHFRLATFRGGVLSRLSDNALPDWSAFHRAMLLPMGGFETLFFGRTVQAIAASGHGGAVWISRREVGLNDVTFTCPVSSGQQALCEQFPTFERRKPWLQSVAGLAAIDGAVVIDTGGRLEGFGAFLPSGSPRTVRQLQPDGTERQVASTTLGGGRHRSAVEFCARFAPAAAAVVSEDGPITVMAAQTPDTVVCASLASVGLSDR